MHARIPIRFDPWYRILSSALLLPPSSAFVEVDDESVRVEMGWAFRARFPTAAVRSVARYGHTTWSRGVHWFARESWIVNGAGDRIAVIDLEPPQRAHVLGVPVRLRRLLVSVDDPEALASLLRSRSESRPPAPGSSPQGDAREHHP